MAEVVGMGVTHYPGLVRGDAEMCEPFRRMLAEPNVPAAAKDPAGWPARMRAEWADDAGVGAATRHRAELFAAFDDVRHRLEQFQPDVLLLVGDDQYENFRETIIPAFCVLAFDQLEFSPFARGTSNYWGDDDGFRLKIRGDREVGRKIADGVIRQDFDAAYAYEPLHCEGLSHAILNTLLFLDHDRRGFDVPVVPLLVNCYGPLVISERGRPAPLLARPARERDPSGPSPARCFALGRALARTLADLPGRIAIIASSSWSHGFLTDKTWRLQPDMAADRRLYDSLCRGNYSAFSRLSTDELEHSGQHELRNWCVLLGAMEEIGHVPSYTRFFESYIFNSNKCFAILDGDRGTPRDLEEAT